MPTVAKRGPGRPVDPDLTERRRAEILDAAARLFARDGFADADTQVLADELRVGKGTIYRYFPSKRELFLALVDRVMRRLREAVDGSLAGVDEPLERVATAIHTYLDFFAEHPEFVELLIQERANFKDRKKPTYFQHRDANVGRWQDLYRGLIAAGRVRQMPVEQITDVLSDLVYGTMFTNYFAGQRRDSSQQADEILDIVFNGILTDAERRRTAEQRLRGAAKGERGKTLDRSEIVRVSSYRTAPHPGPPALSPRGEGERATLNNHDHTDGHAARRAAEPLDDLRVDGAAQRGQRPTRFRRSRAWWAVAAVAAVAVAVLAFTGKLPFTGQGAAAETDGPAKPPPEREPVAVTVAPITPRPVQRAIRMVGTLQGFDQVTITPKVEGQVTAMYHDVGHVVRPGEPLLQVDRTNYENAVAEAEKALGAELAKLSLGLDDLSKQRPDVRKLPGQVRGHLDRLKVKTLPAVVRAMRSEQLAVSQRDRLTKLTGNVSDEELERARTEYDVAVANSRQAIVEAESTVAAARQRLAMLETALQRLDDTTVVVPFPNDESLTKPGETTSEPKGAAATKESPQSELVAKKPAEITQPAVAPMEQAGAQPDEYVVAKKLVVVGTMVRSFPSVPVFELVRDYELKLMGSLPERYVGAVEQPVPGKPPQEVEIVTEAYPSEVFRGRVQIVSPVVETASRTFPVEVRVPNAARKLKAGSFAKARILAREEAVVPTVPEEAIVPFAGVIKVFVVQDGKAHAVEVKPGTRMEIKAGGRTVNWVEVTGDLAPGASVVTSGHSQLAEGTPVRLRGSEGMDGAEKQ